MTERNGATATGKQPKPELFAFADWLVGKMKERRIQNNELALKMGVSTGAISEYRRALRRPREDAQQKIAAVFGAEPEVVYALLDPPHVTGTGASTIGAPRLEGQGVTRLGIIREMGALLAELERLEKPFDAESIDEAGRRPPG